MKNETVAMALAIALAVILASMPVPGPKEVEKEMLAKEFVSICGSKKLPACLRGLMAQGSETAAKVNRVQELFVELNR